MIWVSSSAVLVLVCALSLFWVAPRLQRGREDPVEHRASGADSSHDVPVPPDALPPDASRPRRITMATTDTSSRPSDRGTGHRSGALRIRWDRAGIFLAGCAAVLAGLITAVVAPFSTAVTWPWPVFLLLLGAGSVPALRYLTVQERGARRAARPAPAEHPHAPRADVALFDNEHGAAPVEERRPVPAPEDLDLPAEDELPAVQPSFTVEELRAEALRVARESAATERTWEPVPVPRPTYAEAPVAHRPEPEPLPVPEQPAARSSNLKDAVRAGEEQGRAALNLDDVLRRRRA